MASDCRRLRGCRGGRLPISHDLLTDLLCLVSASIWLCVLSVVFSRAGKKRSTALGLFVLLAAYVALFMIMPSLGPPDRFAEHIPDDKTTVTELTNVLNAVAAIICGLLGSLAAIFLYSTREVDGGAGQK